MADRADHRPHAVDGSERLLWAKHRVVEAAAKHYEYPGEHVFRVALGQRLKELRELEAAIARREAAADRNGAAQRLTRDTHVTLP